MIMLINEGNVFFAMQLAHPKTELHIDVKAITRNQHNRIHHHALSGKLNYLRNIIYFRNNTFLLYGFQTASHF